MHPVSQKDFICCEINLLFFKTYVKYFFWVNNIYAIINVRDAFFKYMLSIKNIFLRHQTEVKCHRRARGHWLRILEGIGTGRIELEWIRMGWNLSLATQLFTEAAVCVGFMLCTFSFFFVLFQSAKFYGSANKAWIL